jgi:hypothetical protein
MQMFFKVLGISGVIVSTLSSISTVRAESTQAVTAVLQKGSVGATQVAASSKKDRNSRKKSQPEPEMSVNAPPPRMPQINWDDASGKGASTRRAQ